MTVNDIIVLLTLIIAVLAIISEKKRSHLRLKFQTVDYLLFAIAFFFINYFVFYSSFFVRGWYLKFLYFDHFGLVNVSRWAYIITLLTLTYLFYKIWKSFYPFSRFEEVFHFYRKLIEDSEVPFLLDLLEHYHKKDVVKIIESSKDHKENKEDYDLITYRFKRETWKQKLRDKVRLNIAILFPLSWENRKAYAQMVLHQIINQQEFIITAGELRPYFYAEIIAHFTKSKRGTYPSDLINDFLSVLIANKNFWLKKELKRSLDFDFGQPAWFHLENKILAALVYDLTVADVNSVWQPFGTAAVNELDEEKSLGNDSKLFKEFFYDEQLWEFKTNFTIQFLKTLIIEAINKDYRDSHFWLYYYDRIFDRITKLWNDYPTELEETKKSIGYQFINIIIDNLFLWLNLSNEKAHPGFYYDILKCMGTIVINLMETVDYPEKEKTALIERLLNAYCHLEDNDELENFFRAFEKMLLEPTMFIKRTSQYYQFFKAAWDTFDKIPFRNFGRITNSKFERLLGEVIVPLNLDPEQY